MSGQRKDEPDPERIAQAVSDSIEHIRQEYRLYLYRMMLLNNRVTSTRIYAPRSEIRYRDADQAFS
jgi:hypothetical protein